MSSSRARDSGRPLGRHYMCSSACWIPRNCQSHEPPLWLEALPTPKAHQLAHTFAELTGCGPRLAKVEYVGWCSSMNAMTFFVEQVQTNGSGIAHSSRIGGGSPDIPVRQAYSIDAWIGRISCHGVGPGPSARTSRSPSGTISALAPKVLSTSGDFMSSHSAAMTVLQRDYSYALSKMRTGSPVCSPEGVACGGGGGTVSQGWK